MSGNFLLQAAVFLAAAAIAAPIAKKLQISSVLGYLAAGVIIGPYGLGFVYQIWQVESILHFAEYGVALLLFLIGLELKPRRLWSMRGSIFGLGGAQVLLCAIALAPVIAWLEVGFVEIAFIALALSLSSTAFVLQVLEEKHELHRRHGRAAFSVLLFQDLAAIPLIALVPLLGTGGDMGGASALDIAKACGAILLVVLFGRYVLSTLYKLVASTGVREAMTASALLTVLGVILIMEAVGLSAALGAFLAGALLADSPYRHQIEADIAPFEGLLLGLFFTAIGMALNLNILKTEPTLLAAGVIALISIKAAVVFGIARWRGLATATARRLALSISQGGEFAFVLFATAIGADVLPQELAETLTVIVTLSMLATPLLLLADDFICKLKKGADPQFDDMPEEEGHVVIAGFGRFGQITARILRARRIPFTAMDISPDQVALVKKFGNEAYFGDVSRLDILESTGIQNARAFVLAIDDVEASLKTAELMRQHFPDVPIYARARNRRHAHELMDRKVKAIRRETFHSALALTREMLQGLGIPEKEARRMVHGFRDNDRKRLYDDYEHYSDQEKVRARARQQIEELEELFNKDEEELSEEREKDTAKDSRKG